MKNIWMLSIANIRKSKANTLSLLIMFIISSLLFSTGMLVLIKFGNYFDQTAEELNSSDTYYLISHTIYNEAVEDYIFHHENVEEVAKENNLWGIFETTLNDQIIGTSYTINDAEVNRTLSRWKLIGEHNPLNDMSIYLPISYRFTYYFELGDEFRLKMQDFEYKFTVAGFVEDIFTTTQETGLVGLYVNNSTFQLLEESCGEESKVVKIFANLKKNNKDVEIGIKELTGAETLSSGTELTNGMFGIDIVIIKSSRILMAMMVSVSFVSFSALIVLACLLVVRFRITNSIEDDMIKIGTLKAIGYTSKQIILSIVVQFGMIAMMGSSVGIGLSYLTVPLLSDLLATQSALIWKQGFDVGISLITLVVILGFVVLVSLFTARRIRRLHPITALRGGIVNHNFRKNHFPLSKSKTSLSFGLALKSMFNQFKQSFMIVIIASAIAFAGAFAVIMYYNTNVDITTFKETPGVELSDVVVYLDSKIENNDVFVEEISKMGEVRKIQYIDTATVFIEGLEVAMYIMEDYSKRETNTIYEGRYPLHHNEISINGYLAEMIDKEIGDTILVSYRGNQEEFLITGFSQGATMMGMNGYMKLEGIKKFIPDFKQMTLHVYLKPGEDAGKFAKMLQTNHMDRALGFIDMDRNMEEGSKSYVDIVSVVGIVILLITTLIIILVLYLVINSSIVRNKRILGIQKSLGFTTFQLMNQISWTYVIPTILGVSIGAFVGIHATNPMMSIMQKSMGVMKANYIIKPMSVVLFGIVIVIISYATALFVTYKIKKISAYSLITE